MTCTESVLMRMRSYYYEIQMSCHRDTEIIPKLAHTDLILPVAAVFSSHLLISPSSTTYFLSPSLNSIPCSMISGCLFSPKVSRRICLALHPLLKLIPSRSRKNLTTSIGMAHFRHHHTFFLISLCPRALPCHPNPHTRRSPARTPSPRSTLP